MTGAAALTLKVGDIVRAFNLGIGLLGTIYEPFGG